MRHQSTSGRRFSLLIAAAVAAGCMASACTAKKPPIPDDDPVPAASAKSPAAAPTGTKAVTITDPVLDMKAYSLTIPANWVFQGAVVQGTPCVPGPFAVIRTSSPDGLTGFKLLPRLDWAWSDNPKVPVKGNAVCLDYKKEMSAPDVLKYMVGVLKVKYLNDVPVPWLATTQKNFAAGNTPTSTNTVDIAMATVQDHINNITIEEQLKVFVGCIAFRGGPMGVQHYCSAQVFRKWAPQGKWSATTFDPIEHSIAIDQQWNQKWNAQMIQKIKEIYAVGNQMLKQQMDSSNARLAAQANAFSQAQDMRQQQHEDFDATLKRGTDMSMKQAAATSDASHRMAGDWADYSLDQQKRLDPATGKISKDSSAYSYTWINEAGQHYQTNDPNDNPNGNNTGNWNMATNIH
jgi:hypothetical protein